jgi:hypothetical protein
VNIAITCLLAINFSLIKDGHITIDTTSPVLISNISKDFPGAILVKNLSIMQSECTSSSLAISSIFSSLLESGHESDVLDNDTFDTISALITQHRGISPQLDIALAALAEDLKYLKGKSKQEIVTFFQP